jgi:hypothetical protein
LDLNSPDGNKGGLLLSNVFIEKTDSIPADFVGMDKLSSNALAAHKEKFKGAIIYNTNPATATGIHVWNGSRWQPMDCLGDPAIPSEITLSATAVTKEGVFAAYISPVSGAKRYEWKLPEGLEATHPDMSQVAIAIRGKQTKIYDESAISVVAINNCGSSLQRISSYKVEVHNCEGVPAKPVAISNSSTLVCADTVQTYSIEEVDGVDEKGYVWEFPDGWEIISGDSTTEVTVTAGSLSGLIHVRATNQCGGGAAQTLAVAVTAVPDKPTVTADSINVCAGATDLIYSVEKVEGVTYTLCANS